MQGSIGIFDSGLGGLTVMNHICEVLPYENLVYLADTARFPYGIQNGEKVIENSIENGRFLAQQGVKAIVIGCNTASIFACQSLETDLKLPIFGVHPDSIAEYLRSDIGIAKRVAIFGTRGTIESREYQTKLREWFPNLEIFSLIDCQLVEAIQNCYRDDSHIVSLIQATLTPILERKVDLLILACTHFSIVKTLIQNFLGDTVQVIDPGVYCAYALKKELHDRGWINHMSRVPSYRFFASKDEANFRIQGTSIFRGAIGEVAPFRLNAHTAH